MKNKDKAIEAIKNDCNGRYRYINYDGATCAVGQLALAAGVSKETLEDAHHSMISVSGRTSVDSIRNAIADMFGLSAEELGHIQGRNDLGETPEERRTSILAYLETL